MNSFVSVNVILKHGAVASINYKNYHNKQFISNKNFSLTYLFAAALTSLIGFYMVFLRSTSEMLLPE